MNNNNTMQDVNNLNTANPAEIYPQVPDIASSDIFEQVRFWHSALNFLLKGYTPKSYWEVHGKLSEALQLLNIISSQEELRKYIMYRNEIISSHKAISNDPFQKKSAMQLVPAAPTWANVLNLLSQAFLLAVPSEFQASSGNLSLEVDHAVECEEHTGEYNAEVRIPEQLKKHANLFLILSILMQILGFENRVSLQELQHVLDNQDTAFSKEHSRNNDLIDLLEQISGKLGEFMPGSRSAGNFFSTPELNQEQNNFYHVIHFDQELSNKIDELQIVQTFITNDFYKQTFASWLRSGEYRDLVTSIEQLLGISLQTEQEKITLTYLFAIKVFSYVAGSSLQRQPSEFFPIIVTSFDLNNEELLGLVDQLGIKAIISQATLEICPRYAHACTFGSLHGSVQSYQSRSLNSLFHEFVHVIDNMSYGDLQIMQEFVAVLVDNSITINNFNVLSKSNYDTTDEIIIRLSQIANMNLTSVIDYIQRGNSIQDFLSFLINMGTEEQISSLESAIDNYIEYTFGSAFLTYLNTHDFKVQTKLMLAYTWSVTGTENYTFFFDSTINAIFSEAGLGAGSEQIQSYLVQFKTGLISKNEFATLIYIEMEQPNHLNQLRDSLAESLAANQYIQALNITQADLNEIIITAIIKNDTDTPNYSERFLNENFNVSDLTADDIRILSAKVTKNLLFLNTSLRLTAAQLIMNFYAQNSPLVQEQISILQSSPGVSNHISEIINRIIGRYINTGMQSNYGRNGLTQYLFSIIDHNNQNGTDLPDDLVEFVNTLDQEYVSNRLNSIHESLIREPTSYQIEPFLVLKDSNGKVDFFASEMFYDYYGRNMEKYWIFIYKTDEGAWKIDFLNVDYVYNGNYAFPGIIDEDLASDLFQVGLLNRPTAYFNFLTQQALILNAQRDQNIIESVIEDLQTIIPNSSSGNNPLRVDRAESFNPGHPVYDAIEALSADPFSRELQTALKRVLYSNQYSIQL